MPVDFAWHDEARTIMRYDCVGRWDWAEFHRTLRRSLLRWDEVTHRVDAWFDFRATPILPAGAVGHLRSLGAKMHTNGAARVVLVGVDASLQARLGARAGLFRDGQRCIAFAGDEADALRQIVQWRTEDAR